MANAKNLSFNPDVIMQIDPWLEPNLPALSYRHAHFSKTRDSILSNEGSYEQFSRGYEKFGLNVRPDNSIVYHEWAPNAVEASLIGDFNNWDRYSHKMTRDQYGVWGITIPSNNGQPVIPHDSKIKISMVIPGGERIERLPAWIKRVTQDLAVSPVYDARFWNPPQPYQFKHPRPPKPTSARIYEAHVGISTPEPRIGTYKEFTHNMLPRIKKLGYNVIQLMAIMEHAYYASSSRYGTPDELKELVDTAHSMGITVLLDVVHSHACKNVLDGLNQFDGTDHQYFHGGGKGYHDLWDSRLFNYSHHEVLRFLLSNLRFWIEEYKFDGFRFDGVTSMMYLHHGIGTGFSGGYHEYFGPDADIEAISYLIIANEMLHEIYPDCITIAEDVSGMPLLCVSGEKGGVGFDYRLAMAVPDMWIKMLKEQSDDAWDMGHVAHTLTNRRYREKTISYAESHDQALVGDKTLAFWLMDKEMYTHMSDLTPLTPIIERGVALHKMIRLISHSLGGEGYLNFEGNEFGHPEWLDFPRAGNGNSFHYARRQFNVADDPLLRYKYLNEFDSAMNQLDDKYKWLAAEPAYVSLKHDGDKVIVYERAGLVFVFNFHPTNSYADYRIGVDDAGEYRPVLSSDEKRFLGQDRIDLNGRHHTTPLGWNNRRNWMHIYIPSRTCAVFAKH
ncbi:alpha-1,4-glucan branching enzyme [Ceratobasidium sp. 392]|nr:alpha-1,4-glucan branching enzyme [Ceratobasidium sp. 392]